MSDDDSVSSTESVVEEKEVEKEEHEKENKEKEVNQTNSLPVCQ